MYTELTTTTTAQTTTTLRETTTTAEPVTTAQPTTTAGNYHKKPRDAAVSLNKELITST